MMKFEQCPNFLNPFSCLRKFDFKTSWVFQITVVFTFERLISQLRISFQWNFHWIFRFFQNRNELVDFKDIQNRKTNVSWATKSIQTTYDRLASLNSSECLTKNSSFKSPFNEFLALIKRRLADSMSVQLCVFSHLI